MEVQEDRVLICKDYNNRPSGEAFVELGDEEEVERSLEKHNQSMGHRWGVITIKSDATGVLLHNYHQWKRS